MTLAGLYFGAIAATVRRDLQIFLSYKLRFVAQMMAMLFTLLSFFYVSKIVRADAVGPHGRYFAFAVVGIVSMSVLTSALGSVQIVRMELMAGNFERMLISPLGPVGGVMAVTAFPILYSLFFAGTMLAFAALIFNVPVDVLAIPLALPVAALGALALGCIGLMFVGALLAFKSAMGATWVTAVLSLLGGAVFPIKLFPGWLRWISEAQPFTPAVDLLRHLLVHTPTVEPVALELGKLGGFAAVLLPVSMIVLRQAVRISRRRGTLMEY